MGENQAQKSDAPVEQIGNGSSSSNKWIAGLVIVGMGVAAFFFLRGGSTQDSTAPALASLRTSMATVCKDEKFGIPATAELNKQYEQSSRMQGVIAELNGMFKRGEADCGRVMVSLKSVDYPL